MTTQSAKEDGVDEGGKSTQNTQYDAIGKKYNTIKTLSAAEPELPSLLAALGEEGVEGKKCLDLACGTGVYTALLSSLGASSITAYDISSAMITAAKSTYPDPSIHFAVRDCSIPSQMQHDDPFDLILATWFLNYAGSEKELTNMFSVIAQNLAHGDSSADGKERGGGGRFIGITTNVHDKNMHLPKMDFYGLDILVLDEAYVDPGSGKKLGIRAKVVVKGENEFSFNVFQFTAEVYERCARGSGLTLMWRELKLPEDERRDTKFWDRCVERPAFSVLEATRL